MLSQGCVYKLGSFRFPLILETEGKGSSSLNCFSCMYFLYSFVLFAKSNSSDDHRGKESQNPAQALVVQLGTGATVHANSSAQVDCLFSSLYKGAT
jgi:hypothetical protein